MKFHHETPDRLLMPVQGNTYTVSREGKDLFTAVIDEYKPAACWAEVQVVSAKEGYEDYYPKETKMRLKVALYTFTKE